MRARARSTRTSGASASSWPRRAPPTRGCSIGRPSGGTCRPRRGAATGSRRWRSSPVALTGSHAHARELSDLAEQTSLLRLPSLRASAHLALLAGEVDLARALLDTVLDEAASRGQLHNLRGARQVEGLLELSLGDDARCRRRARACTGDSRAGVRPRPGHAGVPRRRGRGTRGLRRHRRRREGAPPVREPHGVVRHAVDRTADAASEGHPSGQQRETSPKSPGIPRRCRCWPRATSRSLSSEPGRASCSAACSAGHSGDRLRRGCAGGRALARFEELGARLWAERAREELARIGGRAPSSDDLTPRPSSASRTVSQRG